MPYYQTHNFLEVKNQFTTAGILRIVPQKITIKITNYNDHFIINSGIVIINITEEDAAHITANKHDYKPKIFLPEIEEGQQISVINLTSFKAIIKTSDNGKDIFLDNNINTKITETLLGIKSSISFISAGNNWITV